MSFESNSNTWCFAFEAEHLGDDVIEGGADLLEGLQLVGGLLPLDLVQLAEDLVVEDADAAVDGHQEHGHHLDGCIIS